VKRNQWVIVLVLAAFALMVWSGYANYKRRKQYAQRQVQGTLLPETPITSLSSRMLPPTRAFPICAASAPRIQPADRRRQEAFPLRLQGQGGIDQLLGDLVCAVQD
jgi:hypothetical protein